MSSSLTLDPVAAPPHRFLEFQESDASKQIFFKATLAVQDLHTEEVIWILGSVVLNQIWQTSDCGSIWFGGFVQKLDPWSAKRHMQVSEPT